MTCRIALDPALQLDFHSVSEIKKYCSKLGFITSLFFKDFLHHMCAMMCFSGFYQSKYERGKCLIARGNA